MGPATCKAGSGAEWIVTWVDGWMASGPAAKQSNKANRNKVLKREKHGRQGIHPHAKWGASTCIEDDIGSL